MKPKVSIIVPVYNAEKYLEICVESILNQTYKFLEIILVDDGAKDSSPQICDRLRDKDNRISVIHKEMKALEKVEIEVLKLQQEITFCSLTVMTASNRLWLKNV